MPAPYAPKRISASRCGTASPSAATFALARKRRASSATAIGCGQAVAISRSMTRASSPGGSVAAECACSPGVPASGAGKARRFPAASFGATVHRSARRAGTRSRVGPEPGMAQQRLPEPSTANEIEVLLAAEPIHAGQRTRDRGCDADVAHHVIFGFADEIEAVIQRAGRELVEVARVVDGREIVVEQRGIGPAHQLAEFLPQADVGRLIGVVGVGDQRDERPRLGETPPRIGDSVDVEPEDLPGHAPQVTPGVGVVADERDTLRREATGDQVQHSVAHLRRHPRVDPVRNDVVELPRIGGNVAEVTLEQRDVGEPELRDELSARLDRTRGEIAAHEARRGQVRRHRDQVAAVAATQFERAAARDRRGTEPHQRRDRGEAVGVRRDGCASRIRDLVVRRPRRRGVVGYSHEWCRTSLSEPARSLPCNPFGHRRTITLRRKDDGRWGRALAAALPSSRARRCAQSHGR